MNNHNLVNDIENIDSDDQSKNRIYNLKKFRHGLNELNIDLSDMQIDQFLRYYELLIEWNKVMNLTGITEFEDVIQKHFLDSLSLVKVIPELKDQKILDLGTGAGFPGIPLKIAFPDLQIVLMDSLNKRINFLNEIIRVLNLKDIIAVHGRAEDMARKKEYRQQFDICVSRAVSNLSSLSEYCIPFVSLNGTFISYKSAEADEEIEAARKAIFILGGEVMNVVKFKLPDSDMGRSFVCIKKVKGTPKAYPRKAGTPAKNPIISDVR